MITLTQPKIVLAVELAPELLRRLPHEWPDDHPGGHAQASDAYWRAVLTDVGIMEIEPVALGEWSVPALEVSDQVLEILIRNHIFIGLEEDDENDGHEGTTSSLARDRATWEDLDWELFGALSGGFYWLAEDRILLQPQCCSDLGNYGDWLAITDLQDGEGKSIWIGHPSLPCRRVGDWIQFGRYLDGTPPFGDEVFSMQMHRTEFLVIAEEFTRQMQQFQLRLASLLARMQAPEPARLADTLCPMA